MEVEVDNIYGFQLIKHLPIEAKDTKRAFDPSYINACVHYLFKSACGNFYLSVEINQPLILKKVEYFGSSV